MEAAVTLLACQFALVEGYGAYTFPMAHNPFVNLFQAPYGFQPHMAAAPMNTQMFQVPSQVQQVAAAPVAPPRDLQLNVQLAAGKMDAECQNHGKFDKERNLCMCEMGYMGDKCDCDHTFTCSSHGTCDRSGMCVCQKEYTGPFCSIFVGGSPDQQRMVGEFIKPTAAPVSEPAVKSALLISNTDKADKAVETPKTAPPALVSEAAEQVLIQTAPAVAAAEPVQQVTASRPQYFSYEKEHELENTFAKSRLTDHEATKQKEAEDSAKNMEAAMQIAAEIGNLQAKKFQASMDNVTRGSEDAMAATREEMEVEERALADQSKASVVTALSESTKQAALEEMKEAHQREDDMRQISQQAASAIEQMALEHRRDIESWETRAQDMVDKAVTSVNQRDSKRLLDTEQQDLDRNQKSLQLLGSDAQQMLKTAVDAAEARAEVAIEEQQLIDMKKQEALSAKASQDVAAVRTQMEKQAEQMEALKSQLRKGEMEKEEAQKELVAEKTAMVDEVSSIRSKLQTAEKELVKMHAASTDVVQNEKQALVELQARADSRLKAALTSVTDQASHELQTMQIKLEEARQESADEKREEESIDSRLAQAEQQLAKEHSKTISMQEQLKEEDIALQTDIKKEIQAKSEFEVAAGIAQREAQEAMEEQQAALKEQENYAVKQMEVQQQVSTIKKAEERKRQAFEKMFSEKSGAVIKVARIG